jgi:hypothetical protein
MLDGPLFRDHPVAGELLIAHLPKSPTIDNPQIELKRVDRLTFHKFRQPDDDKSGIELGQNSLQFSELAEKFLVAAGISGSAISLSGGDLTLTDSVAWNHEIDKVSCSVGGLLIGSPASLSLTGTVSPIVSPVAQISGSGESSLSPTPETAEILEVGSRAAVSLFAYSTSEEIGGFIEEVA